MTGRKRSPKRWAGPCREGSALAGQGLMVPAGRICGLEGICPWGEDLAAGVGGEVGSVLVEPWAICVQVPGIPTVPSGLPNLEPPSRIGGGVGHKCQGSPRSKHIHTYCSSPGPRHSCVSQPQPQRSRKNKSFSSLSRVTPRVPWDLDPEVLSAGTGTGLRGPLCRGWPATARVQS